jgi:hypothetical protein
MKERGERERILVLQQGSSGESKIKGIGEFGAEGFEVRTFTVQPPLPSIIDDATPYLPLEIDADVVLDYLKHPDLSLELAEMCRRLNVPVVASGAKLDSDWPHTPPVCCALPPHASCGAYARRFGYPRFEVEIGEGRITSVRVLRGAPCGATWHAATRLAGLSPEEAKVRIGLETQYFCTANPAAWDPITQKSPVHIAGKAHAAALKAALKRVSASAGRSG